MASATLGTGRAMFASLSPFLLLVPAFVVAVAWLLGLLMAWLEMAWLEREPGNRSRERSGIEAPPRRATSPRHRRPTGSSG
jgi:hypothetical protein